MLAYLIAHSAAFDEDVVPTRGTLAYLMAHSVGGLGSFEPPAVPTYADVAEEHCAYTEIEYVASLGLMAAYPDGTFRPDFEIYRGQMAVYTARVINLTDGDLGSYIPPTAPTFWDVPTDYWAYLYIEYIVDKGIATGYPDGSFRPADSMDAYGAADWLEAATGTYVDPGEVPPCGAEGLTWRSR